MEDHFTGTCQCGEIQYECSAAPLRVYHCHCVNCQKSTGSAFHTGLIVPRDAVTYLKGEPKTWDRPADTGNTVTEGFCGTCGTPIFVQSSGRPNHMSLKAGTTDDPGRLRAEGQIWLASAVPWHDTCLATDRHQQGYPMGPVPPE